MRRSSPRRVSRETPVERRYKEWVHAQLCVGRAIWGLGHDCAGRVEQSHERSMTGLGCKERNSRSVAMCSRLHAQWEQHAGAFYAWTKGQRRAWMEERIIEANARFELETGLSLTAARY